MLQQYSTTASRHTAIHADKLTTQRLLNDGVSQYPYHTQHNTETTTDITQRALSRDKSKTSTHKLFTLYFFFHCSLSSASTFFSCIPLPHPLLLPVLPLVRLRAGLWGGTQQTHQSMHSTISRRHSHSLPMSLRPPLYYSDVPPFLPLSCRLHITPV